MVNADSPGGCSTVGSVSIKTDSAKARHDQFRLFSPDWSPDGGDTGQLIPAVAEAPEVPHSGRRLRSSSAGTNRCRRLQR